MSSPEARAYAFLRSHLSGRLRFDEHHEPVKIVIAADGRLVVSAMVAMLRSFDTVLFLPDDTDDALQLQVTIEELDERGPLGALTDRWQAYHGSPPDVRWALLLIDGAKFEGHFIDGAALAVPNPLAAEEPRLCRELNADGETLRRACDRGLPKRIERPVLVGVDPLGFDVRGAFDVFRLAAPSPMNDADAARSVMQTLASA